MLTHYGTLVKANLFFESRLHSYEWEVSNLNDRTKAMTQATELVDQFSYLGAKYAVAALPESATDEQVRIADKSQALQFPRGAINEVPVEVERATYLIAKALLSGRDPNVDLEALSNKSASYGGVRTSYARDGHTQQHLTHLIPDAQAFNLLLPLMRVVKSFDIFRV